MFSVVLSGCKKNEESTEEATPTIAANTQEQPTVTPVVEAVVTEVPAVTMQMGTVDVKEDVIFEEDFEDGKTDFTGRGAAKVEIVKDKANDGANSMFVTGRTALWNGATINLTEKLEVNQSYKIEVAFMYENGPDTMQIDTKVEQNNSAYLNFASAMATKGVWSTVIGNIIIPEGTTTASVYFETGFTGADLLDFYVDSIKITKELVTADRGVLPALKDIYKDNFKFGVAATVNELTPIRQVLVQEQFNSVTPGNELKPDSVLDYNTCISDPKYDDNPAVNFSRIEPIFKVAKELGLSMRGHTLVWHSQTPRWFFAVGYSKDAAAPLVTKELMLKRMENYIKQVIEYTQTNYPGLIYAWDVVNEAVEPGDAEEGGLRSKDSLWYQVVGPEFIEKAFEFARKYADKDVKLIYNDYNTEDKGKMLAIYEVVKGLKDKGLVDGIGLQTHITIDSPSLMDIEASIRKYAELGLELQITELDMGMTDNTEEAYFRQAKRYKRLFTMLKNIDDTGAANITSITFWGLTDDISWLSKPGQPSYPLLFDKYMMQKPAFWAVALNPGVPLY